MFVAATITFVIAVSTAVGIPHPIAITIGLIASATTLFLLAIAISIASLSSNRGVISYIVLIIAETLIIAGVLLIIPLFIDWEIFIEKIAEWATNDLKQWGAFVLFFAIPKIIELIIAKID